MKSKRFAIEQIISKLRQAEIMFSEGKNVEEVSKKLEITAQTYYRWRKEYGTLQMDQAKRLKELEKENTRLKRVVADQALDISILKEVSKGNF
jgi:putative transposase